MKNLNILFVCKYNRFRSRIAETYFKKINKTKKIKIKSAGIIIGSPISEEQKSVGRKFGLTIKGQIQGLSSKLLKWQNLIIIVADDVPPQLFRGNKMYGKELIIWKIKDTKKGDKQKNAK